MSANVKKISIVCVCMLIGCTLSFFSFNGIYFIMAIPYLLTMVSYKKEYLYSAIVGVLVSSFVLDYRIYALVVLVTLFATYLFLFLTRNSKITIRNRMALSGTFASIVLLIGIYMMEKDIYDINLFFIPILSYVLCFNVININYDLKMRENISVTKKQMAFIAFVFNMLASSVILPVGDFNFGFVIAALANYVFVRIDPLIGVLGCMGFIFMNQFHIDVITLCSIISLVFIVRNLRNNLYIRSIVYFAASFIVSAYFHNYTIMLETIIVSIVLLIITDEFINSIYKYVIEPQDYELKLYQQSYYKCLNRNKKIQKVMTSVEENIKSTKRMSKCTRELMLKSMQFLSDKLKEEDNIHLKEQIFNELEYKKMEILEFKIMSDFFYNYKILLEIKRNDYTDDDKIIDVFENGLQLKLKIKRKMKNQILRTVRYEIVNDEPIKLEYVIKQRSKEGGICGDSYVIFETKNKKFFMVSDGMGCGKKASKESAMALSLLRDFLELGMSPDDAIVSCNALLLDKQGEKFNTLDLLECDIFVKQITLYKNGSGTTYVKKGDNVDKISSENLPLGIVDNIRVERKQIPFDNELIILTSDGIKKDLDILLENTNHVNPKAICNEILQHEGNLIEDDQTIVVINVIKND